MTQTGLPSTVPSALPGAQPTSASVVNAPDGTSVKPQLKDVSAELLSATVQIAKNFWPPALTKLAPEPIGIWN